MLYEFDVHAMSSYFVNVVILARLFLARYRRRLNLASAESTVSGKYLTGVPISVVEERAQELARIRLQESLQLLMLFRSLELPREWRQSKKRLLPLTAALQRNVRSLSFELISSLIENFP